MVNRRDRMEAITMIKMYRDLATSMLRNEEYRYRAEEILCEIGGRWSE